MNIQYTEKDGILYPDFRRSEDFKTINSLGKYGRMALKYLQEEFPHRILEMKINGKLIKTLSQVDTEAKEMMITLQKQMLQNEPLDNPRNFMESVRHMNSIHMASEEIVLSEIVFRKR